MSDIAKYALKVAGQIQKEVNTVSKPSPEGTKPKKHQLVDFNLVKGTGAHLERVVHQINGAYEHGWYDACAVMLRRLIETLVIEMYIARGMKSKIKTKDGSLVNLNKLVARASSEPSWELDRGGKSLQKLKQIGNWSAHKRLYNANRDDIDTYESEIRIVIQELVYLAGYKMQKGP